MIISELGWVITEDHLSHLSDGSDYPSIENVGQYEDQLTEETGLWARTVRVTESVNVEEIADPIRFKLRDDDNILYYEGVISESWLNFLEEYAFAPLFYTELESGCTIMEVEQNGEWVIQ